MAERRTVEPNVVFIEKIKEAGGDSLKNCFQCATCSTVCNLSPAANPFPRKEMIWAQWGLEDRLLGDPDVWLCHQCTDCTTYCPRGAKPGDVLAAVRKHAFEKFAFPGFMGKIAATPSLFPVLLLIPVVLLLAVLAGTGRLYFPQGEVIYAKLFGVATLQYFFITGTTLAFLVFIVSISRFWQAMNKNGIVLTHPENKQGFVAAFIGTVLEIATHKKFSDCGDNSVRQYAHLLTFYGFIGLAATAGLGAFYEIILHTPSPYPLLHPVKILGNLSMLAILIGLTILVVRRMQGHEKSGSSTYQDKLFLYDLYVVAVTGIFLEIFRLSGIGWLAYSTYFVHLTFIIILLLFAPYSKFAHMGYRFVAILWARMNGRGEPGALQYEQIVPAETGAEQVAEGETAKAAAVNG